MTAGDTLSLPARVAGATDIAPRVVERIAGKLASEIPGVFSAPATGVGRLIGRSSSIPKVTADVEDDRVALDVDIAARYPLPLGTTGAEIRTTLERRVPELTGLLVTEVRVNVVACNVGDHPTPRVR
jgi:uncharacterized alkaline shock family protein YloU